MPQSTLFSVAAVLVLAASCAYPDFAVESASDASGGTKHVGGKSSSGGASELGGSSGGVQSKAAGGAFAGVLTDQAGRAEVNQGASAGAAVGGETSLGGAVNAGGTNAIGGVSATGGAALIGGTSATAGNSAGGTTGNGGGGSSAGRTAIGGYASGGAATGGTATGGTATGGTATGGTATGGTATGGTATGGTATGGTATGGTATGGSATGGAATGGAATGGTATGGTPACGTQLLVNPNFDLGQAGWTTYSSGGYDVLTNENKANAPTIAYTSPNYAWLGGYDGGSDWLLQSVNIPAAFTSATLTFYYYIETEEKATAPAYDVMTVELVDVGTNQVIQTLRTFSNLSVVTAWTSATLPITGALGGRAISIRFTVTTGTTKVTNFCIDSVAFTLAAC